MLLEVNAFYLNSELNQSVLLTMNNNIDETLDLNTISTNSITIGYTNQLTNYPENMSGGSWICVLSFTSWGYVFQLLISPDNLYFRRREQNNVWTDWKHIGN